MFRRTEARKNGPIKALQPVVTDGSGNNNKNNSRMPLSKSLSQDAGRSSRYQRHTQMSKDDILMTHGHTKEKVKANPYATIKMWRPTSTDGASAKDVYQTFTNFDALRLNTDPDWNVRKERQLPNGDRNTFRTELSYHGSQHGRKDKIGQSQGQISNHTDLTNHKVEEQHGISSLNGSDEIPADYSRENSPVPLFRRVSVREGITIDPSLINEVAVDNPSIHSVNLPSSPKLHLSSHMSSVIPPHPPPLPSSPIHSTKEQQSDTSFQIVSDGATNSIKLVLSHRYTDIELVGKDVERLLAELKLTMNTLKTSHIDKKVGQLSTCLTELHSQTKQFIQEAKLVVSSANNSQEKMMLQVEAAVHTLAHVFLHGQATMLLMTSPDHAIQLGFQIIKVANSFKSTISAASLALGKTLNDPNMKYLMRLAQNLAVLLASLVNMIKEVHIH